MAEYLVFQLKNGAYQVLEELSDGNNNRNVVIFLSDGMPFVEGHLGNIYYPRFSKEIEEDFDATIFGVGFNNNAVDFSTTLKEKVSSVATREDRQRFPDELSSGYYFYQGEKIGDIFDNIYSVIVGDQSDQTIQTPWTNLLVSPIEENNIIEDENCWMSLQNTGRYTFKITAKDSEGYVEAVENIDISSTIISIKVTKNGVESEKAKPKTLIEWAIDGYFAYSGDYIYLNLSQFAADEAINITFP